MTKPAIAVENLGKCYRLNELANLPIALQGQSATNDILWANRHLSFTIEAGEVVGFMGSNGAGKSTLLKMLARIVTPTEGIGRIRGKVGALLEVGTGLHPNLTGLENIFLTGAILGMSRRDIRANLDMIVEFAGIERFLHTPIKRYSSGMCLRLGFSVAAHLNSDILIVDEALSVGDASFQKQCFEKMLSIAQQEGRTVLFVSHDQSALRQFCSRLITLKDGRLVSDCLTRNTSES